MSDFEEQGGGMECHISSRRTMKKIIRLGNCSPGRHGATEVHSVQGISPIVMMNHGYSVVIQVGGGGEMMVKDNNGNHFALRSQNKQLIETIQKNEFREGEPKVMDLYNRRANEKVSPTLDDPTHNDRRLYDGLRIRRLTPKECWRLMGFSDEDFEKARAVNSDTQLYKQAGNSIVVDVLVAILRNLLTGDREEQEIQRELW